MGGVIVLAVDAARWWGPLGWLYRNCPGNLAAGFLQIAIAAAVATLLWPPTRRAVHRFADAKVAALHARFARREAHDRWVAEHLAQLHQQVTGRPAAEHPDLGQL